MTIIDELNKHQQTLQQAFNLDGKLYFRELSGSICNSPIYVYQMVRGKKVTVGVLKPEIENLDFAKARFAMLDELATLGFDQHPAIFKNRDGSHLTKIGSRYYSFIEYIKPNKPSPEQVMDFASMLDLTREYHLLAKQLTFRPKLAFSRFEQHLARQHIVDELDSLTLGTDFFKNKAWQRFLPFYQSFNSPKAKALFDNLPKQMIIGGNHQGNLISREGKIHFVDLDARRYDARLLDLTTIIRHSHGVMKDEYFALAESDKLLSVINEHYEKDDLPLTALEKQHFHTVLAFGYVEFISWALNRAKEYALSNQSEKIPPLLERIEQRVQNVLRQIDLGLVDEHVFSADQTPVVIACHATVFQSASDPSTTTSKAAYTPTPHSC